MDKRQISFMVVTVLAIAAFWVFRWQAEKAHPEWAQELEKQQQAATQSSTTSSSAPPTTGPASQPATFASATTGPSIGAAPIAGLHVKATTQPAQEVMLGSAANEDKTYAMQVALTPNGAGVEKVTLNDFRQKVEHDDRYVFQTRYEDASGSEPLATQWVIVNGISVDLSGPWELASSDAASATYVKDILDGETPVLRIARTYRVPQRKTPSKGFDIQADYTFQNLSGKPLKLQTSFNGPTVPPKEVERGADRQIITGYAASGGGLKVSQLLVEGVKAEQDITKKDPEPLLWSGTGSVYFSAIVLPGYTGNSIPANAVEPKYTVLAKGVSTDESDLHDVQMTFTTAAFDVAPNQTAALPLSVFLGPKQRALFEDNAYYSGFPRQYDQTLVIKSQWCGFCTFSWLIGALVSMLSFFHWIWPHDWGLSIIVLVVLVRICLHPITKRSQIQMMSMGKMGPEIERLKAKYGDNKDALNKAMMQVYKQQGMAPVLGCLPMFLQMPIWIALWSALQSTFELRQSPFLWFGHLHLTWISDLANPDRLISFTPFKLPLIGWEIASLNLLPILMGIVAFLQQKYTPKPMATTPEQAQQQKMAMFMSTALLPIFLYKSPAGLNLYIFASTSYGIIESKIIRKHIREREELEKKQRVIIDAKPTRASKNRIDEPPAAKPKGLMGWLAELQEKAEQIRKEQK